MKKKIIDILDGFRAIAIIIVMFFHFFQDGQTYTLTHTHMIIFGLVG